MKKIKLFLYYSRKGYGSQCPLAKTTDQARELSDARAGYNTL